MTPLGARLTTPDPHSSAIPLIEGATYHGMPPTALAMVGSGALSQYSPMGQFGDGMGLYAYLASNPGNLLDPHGLFFSYVELENAVATQGIWGALFGGIASKVSGGSFQEGFVTGAVLGTLFGLAFAPAAAGITVAELELYAGVAGGTPALATLRFSAGAINGMSRGGTVHITRSMVEGVLENGSRIPDPNSPW